MFFCMVPLFSAIAYSGERTNSQLGTPIVSRKTTTFFVHLYDIRLFSSFQYTPHFYVSNIILLSHQLSVNVHILFLEHIKYNSF